MAKNFLSSKLARRIFLSITVSIALSVSILTVTSTLYNANLIKSDTIAELESISFEKSKQFDTKLTDLQNLAQSIAHDVYIKEFF